ncbi:hypothetical protein [Nitrosopumilus sp. S4]
MENQVYFCGHKPIVLQKQSKQFKNITMRLCADCADLDCFDD